MLILFMAEWSKELPLTFVLCYTHFNIVTVLKLSNIIDITANIQLHTNP